MTAGFTPLVIAAAVIIAASLGLAFYHHVTTTTSTRPPEPEPAPAPVYPPPTVSCLDHDPTPRADCVACLEASAYCPHGRLLEHDGCPPRREDLT